MVRIRSEHAIGFLKGRFQSLKGLRINIKNEKSHKMATYWVVCCIAIHGFAMQRESDDHDLSSDEDPFIQEGLESDDPDSRSRGVSAPLNQLPAVAVQRSSRAARSTALALAKEKRIELRDSLLAAREQRQSRRRRFFGSSSESESVMDET